MEALAAVPVIQLADQTAISARVGIATGPVVVGDLIGASGREEGAVTGETPNLAARIQAAAETGEPLVAAADRQRGWSGESVSVRVGLGGCSDIQKKKTK